MAPLSRTSPRPPLEKVWEFEASNKIEAWLTPIVAHGMVYFGCKDGSIYALETTSGHEKWMFKTSSPPPLASRRNLVSSPAIGGPGSSRSSAMAHRGGSGRS